MNQVCLCSNQTNIKSNDRCTFDAKQISKKTWNKLNLCIDKSKLTIFFLLGISHEVDPNLR